MYMVVSFWRGIFVKEFIVDRSVGGYKAKILW